MSNMQSGERPRCIGECPKAILILKVYLYMRVYMCVRLQVVGSTHQQLEAPNNATYIGSGKVAEVSRAVAALKVACVDRDKRTLTTIVNSDS